MTEIKIVCEAGNRLGEGPLWHPVRQELWWVDIEPGIIHAWSEATGHREVLKLDYRIGTYAFTQTEDLILATERGVERWHADTRSAELLHPLEIDPQYNVVTRFNDGAVDARGRFWIGSMPLNEAEYHTPAGKLFRFDPDGSLHLMETEMTISNGIDWSADGETMLFTDSVRRRIYAYDFDMLTGTISNRRTLIQIAPDSGVPDGLTYDAEGYIWSARYDGFGLFRYAPDGTEHRFVPLGTQSPTSMTFGGENLDTLYCTSARPNGQVAEGDRVAGSLVSFKPGVKGRPVNIFGG